MDDLDDLQACEFVTDTEDQDSLDERIESEQRLRNQQLWASFQNAACCITKLYKDRAQPNFSPWIPFQNAASNLTTLYKDCIESQRSFAKIGYQVGRRRRMRDLKKLIKKHKLTNKQPHQVFAANDYTSVEQISNDSILAAQSDNRVHSEPANCLNTGSQQHSNNVASILAVNQLNLSCDAEMPSDSMQAQPSNQMPHTQSVHNHHQQTPSNQQQQLLGNNEDDLVTFQQALAQPTVRGIKTASQQARRLCSNNTSVQARALVDSKSEEDRLFELNQFLSEEYHRHVGSRKRSCSTLGGAPLKRLRE